MIPTISWKPCLGFILLKHTRISNHNKFNYSCRLVLWLNVHQDEHLYSEDPKPKPSEHEMMLQIENSTPWNFVSCSNYQINWITLPSGLVFRLGTHAQISHYIYDHIPKSKKSLESNPKHFCSQVFQIRETQTIMKTCQFFLCVCIYLYYLTNWVSLRARSEYLK